MSEAQEDQPHEERAPESVDKQPDNQPTEKEDVQDPSPDHAYSQEMPAEYNSNAQMMNTMPQMNNENNVRGSNDYNQSNTQNNFNPRRTFHAQSTDRGGYGMKRFARLTSNWDQRFHVSPSINNKKSHTFYKQFFDKPTRSTQGIALKPRKRLDPFLENETKSRIPRYSKIYKDRDVQKEMSWVDNFAMTHSKNNHHIHQTYKEYFDKPVYYKGWVTVGTTKGVANLPSPGKISTK